MMTELTIIHLNARTVGNKIKDIHTLTIVKKPDIISLNQTWLKNNETLTIKNYTTYKLNRSRKRGGGVAILVKGDIKHDNVCYYGGQYLQSWGPN